MAPLKEKCFPQASQACQLVNNGDLHRDQIVLDLCYSKPYSLYPADFRKFHCVNTEKYHWVFDHLHWRPVRDKVWSDLILVCRAGIVRIWHNSSSYRLRYPPIIANHLPVCQFSSLSAMDSRWPIVLRYGPSFLRFMGHNGQHACWTIWMSARIYTNSWLRSLIETCW